MEKNKNRVIIFALALIVAGYFVLDKLTKNYLPPVMLSEKKCENINADENPKALADCLEEMSRYDMENNSKPNSKFIKEGDFKLTFKMYVEGELKEDLETNKQDSKLVVTRKDSYKLIMCGSNLSSFIITGSEISLTPNLDKPFIFCLDKETKQIIHFAASSVNPKDIKEMSIGMQSIKDQDLSVYEEIR